MVDNSEEELMYVILRDITGTDAKAPTSFLAPYRDLVRARSLIPELMLKGYIDRVNDKLVLTQAGEAKKKALADARKAQKSNAFFSVADSVYNGTAQLCDEYRQFLAISAHREYAALIIAISKSESKVAKRDITAWLSRKNIAYDEAIRTSEETILDKLFIIRDLNDFKKTDTEKYEIYVCVDEKTCKKCKAFRKKTFLIESAQIGVNCPPFHDGCRCGIFPVLQSEEDMDKELAELGDEIGADVPFGEWVRGLVRTPDGKLVYRKKQK